MVHVATIKQLFVHPVKSMQALAVDCADLGWFGLNGDRRYAFVRSNQLSGFPWFTGRQAAAMLRYRPYFERSDKGADASVRVQTPCGADHALDAPELLQELSELAGEPLHLMQLNRGTFDEMPASLLSTSSCQALGDMAGMALDIRRFRINIILDLVQHEPFAEDQWASQILRFGEQPDAPELVCTSRIKRCMMVNLDPDSAQSNPAVLKQIASYRDTCFGIHSTIKQLGTIRVGNPVFLTR